MSQDERLNEFTIGGRDGRKRSGSNTQSLVVFFLLTLICLPLVWSGALVGGFLWFSYKVYNPIASFIDIFESVQFLVAAATTALILVFPAYAIFDWRKHGETGLGVARKWLIAVAVLTVLNLFFLPGLSLTVREVYDATR
ncbi:MAG: hypothetical protein H6752_16240 [Candidatus Omnitrophica bacterium]|nr:hypothetical protein [Candidatus Omnitrophota bacterium]